MRLKSWPAIKAIALKLADVVSGSSVSGNRCRIKAAANRLHPRTERFSYTTRGIPSVLN